MNPHKIFRIVAGLLIVATSGLGQESRQETIRGTVRDPQGKLVDGAELALYREGSASQLARTRSVQGAFTFEGSTPGRYLIEVTAAGFRTASVTAGDGRAVEVTLDIAGVDQRVFVTAEGTAQTIDQVSKAASIIGSEEIEQRDEYSLSETLRDTPGLLVRNLGGPGQSTTVRMRGLRADATAVLIDGLRFRDSATTQADSSSFISALNVIQVDRVEVLRGSGSSLYGTNAVGGTVNVVSDAGGGPLHGGIQMEGGSLGLLRGRATMAGGLWQDRLAFSAGLLHLNVMSGVDGDDRARSSGVQSFARYALTPKFSLMGRLLLSDDFVQPNLSPTATGLPAGNIPATTIVDAIALPQDQLRRSEAGLPIVPGNATFIPSRNDPDNRRASRFWSGALIARHAFSPIADWQVSYQRVHTDRTFQNGPAGAGTQPRVSNISRFRGDIETVDSRLNWRPKAWYSLSGGYEFEDEDYFNLDNNRLPAPGTVSTRTITGQKSHAAYFANQISTLSQRLQISMSGRMQAFRLGDPTFVYEGAADPYSALATTAPPRALTGDVALSYFVPESGTKLRTHVGNSYRAPGLYERYGSGFFYNATTNAVSFTPYGDPRLAPDRYNSVDAGVDQYLFHDRLRLSGTWFYTRIVQLTQFDSAGNAIRPGFDPFGRTSGYFNGAGGISRGMEFTAEARPLRGTFFRGSYSYVNADTDQDSAVRGFFGALSVPPHTVNAMMNQRVSRRGSVTVDLYHSSDYYNSLSAGGRARAYHYSGATKTDVVFDWEIRSGEKQTWKWYAKVDNVLNQRYYENGFRAPRATLITGLRAQFR